jgi:uncharacterized protein
MRILALTFVIVCTALPLGAGAQPRPTPPPEGPTLTISGQGLISRTPDRATLGCQIITNNDSAATATSQNNTIYNGLRSRLTALGIAESAIRTQSFNVNYIPKPADSVPYKPPRTGYVVTRSLGVTIDNLELVGRAIDAAVAAGVTDVGAVSYGIRDNRGAYAAALAAAVRDAESQATAIAEAAHVRLSGIRSISTSSFAPIPVPLVALGRVAAAPANVPTEIPPSNIDVRASVNITYYLR